MSACITIARPTNLLPFAVESPKRDLQHAFSPRTFVTYQYLQYHTENHLDIYYNTEILSLFSDLNEKLGQGC